MGKFIYENSDWPKFTWDAERLAKPLSIVRLKQGKISGKMSSTGLHLQSQAILEAISTEIVQSSAIEGEHLNYDLVKSSVSHKLGAASEGILEDTRDVDGVVNMVTDATKYWDQEVSEERLCRWHAYLFARNSAGNKKISVGQYRNDLEGRMHVISGPWGRERIHFTAPEAHHLNTMMGALIDWINSDKATDSLLNAGIAHLWLLTIHPFDDGNGRVARALTEYMLCRSESSSQRYYSLSAQILADRKRYYAILEQTQRGSMDISDWLIWFIESIGRAIDQGMRAVDLAVAKHSFWHNYKTIAFNQRQLKVINLLLDGFFGKLTNAKWAKLCKCSSDTALRDIQNLVDRGILEKSQAGGRSTHYYLSDFPPDSF